MPTPFPLIRDVAALKDREFDLLVVGGGIYGAWTAYDAAQRGLSVALVERDDWAAGTSSASSKLIHGGLRYLEHYDFGLVLHALAERRRLHRIARHLVRPLDFVMPVWKGPRASVFMLSCGLFLYDLLGLPRQPVRWHRHFRRGEMLARYPFLDPERLLGGFRYGDCQEDDARMTLAVVAAAQGAGAVVANRVEALSLEHGGATLRDAAAGDRFAIKASVTVNAAGPWAPGLLGDQAPAVERIKGIHIVLPAIPECRRAFLLTANDGRVFFVIPWYGRTLVGTTEQKITNPDAIAVSDEEVAYLLAGVNNGLPGLGWTMGDVIGRFAGVRTLQAEDEQDLAAVTREFTILEPRPGVIMPLGGKYTTARCDAADIVDLVQQRLGRPRGECRTGTALLPGAPAISGPFENWHAEVSASLREAGIDGVAAHWLVLRHGTRVERVRELIAENPAWNDYLVPGLPFLKAEVAMAVRDEMALSFDDVFRRRMPLALLAPDMAGLRARLRPLLGELGLPTPDSGSG